MDSSMAYPSYTQHPSSAGPSSSLPSSIPTPTTTSSSSNSNSTPPTASNSDKALRKSCQHCRKRKIKCLSIPGSSSCKACSAKGQPCLFEKQSQMGRPPKAAAAAAAAGAAATAAGKSASTSKAAGMNDPSLSACSSSSRKRRSLTAEANPAEGSSKKPKLPPDDDGSRAVLTGKTYHQEAPAADGYYAQPHRRSESMQYYQSPYALSSSSSSSSAAFHPHPHPRHMPAEWQQPNLPYPPTAIAAGSSSKQQQHIYPPANAQLPALDPSTSSSAAEAAVNLSSATSNPSAQPAAICIQTEADPLPFFRNSPLHTLVSAFHHILSSSVNHLSPASTPVLSDPRVSSIARMRTLNARATATRKPVDRGPQAATPTYARSLISPLWDGLPVDIIALTTTGKPSASGPFSISSEASKRSPLVSASSHDEYLYVKLLREDESTDFLLSKSRQSPSSLKDCIPDQKGLVFPKDSPGFRYAPDKMTVGKFFTGYFSKHPLAPLVLNERIFVDDLVSNRVDPLLLHVIVGSSIARAPCLGAGQDDAEDIGDEFFSYIEDELLSRTLDGSCDIQTCQSLMLWATHELSHMRVRRANALWNTADVLLRQRASAFRARVEEEAAYNSKIQAGHITPDQPAPVPLGWRDLVEQELTVNALWVIVIWNTWTSLSLKLPHNTMSIMAQSLPAPPHNVNLSSSFAFAYSTADLSSPLQAVVRRTIERFSDITQLINVIVSLKNQKQAKNLFAPDPPRPLAVIDDEEAQIATWLVDLAKYYNADSSNSASASTGVHQQLIQQNKLSESSRAFLVASHAVLALHQILPYTTASSSSYGSPLPLPTVESLRTALSALHLVSRSIQTASPGSRTRTQAILLDSMPRILSLLDIFTSSALSSLDHFVLVTSQRNMVHELLNDLNRAVASMNQPSNKAAILDSCGDALEKSSKGLRTVVDIGSELQNSQHRSTSVGQFSEGMLFSRHGLFGTSSTVQGEPLSGTASASPSSADGAPWFGSQSQSYGAWSQPDHALTPAAGSYPDVSNAAANTYSNNAFPSHTSFAYPQHNQPSHISMSSHLVNSPLLHMHDHRTGLSPSYVGSLHAYL